MTSLAHTPAAFPVPTRAVGAREQTMVGLRLLPSGDGWSLVGPEGNVVFEALGSYGRRRCLEFARAHGVLAVFS